MRTIKGDPPAVLEGPPGRRHGTLNPITHREPEHHSPLKLVRGSRAKPNEGGGGRRQARQTAPPGKGRARDARLQPPSAFQAGSVKNGITRELLRCEVAGLTCVPSKAKAKRRHSTRVGSVFNPCGERCPTQSPSPMPEPMRGSRSLCDTPGSHQRRLGTRRSGEC